jgi:hypothetical protein
MDKVQKVCHFNQGSVLTSDVGTDFHDILCTDMLCVSLCL